MPPETLPPPPTGGELNIKDLGKTRVGGSSINDPELLKRAQAKAGGAPVAAPSPAPDPAPAPVPSPAPEAPAPSPGSKPPPSAATSTPEPSDKPGIKQLREAYEKAQERLKQLEVNSTSTAEQIKESASKLAEAASKLAAREEEIEKTYKPQVQRLSDLEKHNAKLEEQLRIKDFTSSPDWHKAYVKPIADARAEADAYMSELVVPTGEGKERQATRQDFEAVLGASNLNSAVKVAKALFGDDFAQTVINLRTKILGLERIRRAAYDSAALESEAAIKRHAEEQAQFLEKTRALYGQELARIETEEKEWLTAPDTDQELKDAMASGTRDADRIVQGDPKMTREEQVKILARVRSDTIQARAAKILLKRANAKVADLEKQLAGYHKSEPDLKGRTTTAAAAQEPEKITSAQARDHIRSRATELVSKIR